MLKLLHNGSMQIVETKSRVCESVQIGCRDFAAERTEVRETDVVRDDNQGIRRSLGFSGSRLRSGGLACRVARRVVGRRLGIRRAADESVKSRSAYPSSRANWFCLGSIYFSRYKEKLLVFCYKYT